MCRRKKIITSLLLLLTFPAHSLAESVGNSWHRVASITYFGVCDGSAAVRLDDTTLLVANDETNVLHSFDIWGGPPVASVDLNNLLVLDPKKPEIDFEAVARNGDLIWWIGSHGRNKKGKKRPNRRMFFATNVPARDLSDLRVVSPQYNLVPILQAHSTLADILTDEVVKTAPKKGGLNIEGLAIAPDGRVSLGLRAPLTEAGGMTGDALIVTISAADEVWSVTSIARLPLKNTGIRDMVWDNDKMMIISGPVDSGGPFSLFTWDGISKLELVEAPAIDDLNPEALVAIGSKWLVLSDDGSKMRTAVNGGAEECKDLADVGDTANVYFRASVLSQR